MMKYWFSKIPENKCSIRVSFPPSEAELLEELVEDIPELKLGLEMFAKQLAEQLNVEGVNITGIKFSTRKIYSRIK